MRIAFFGSSLLSAYWNGAATYYRGILKALAARGHEVIFLEPDAFDRQRHRDIEPPDWARVVVYAADAEGLREALGACRRAPTWWSRRAASACSTPSSRRACSSRPGRCPGRVLGRRCARHARPARAPIRRTRCARCCPSYDLVLTYGGGAPVCDAYRRLGARLCAPIYNALDPDDHHPVPPDARFAGDLAFLGNRLPDREARVEAFFFAAAAQAPEQRFLLGGSGWDGQAAAARTCAGSGTCSTRDHNAFNSTARCVLNVSRESMARNGWSPATRVFEAAAPAPA